MTDLDALFAAILENPDEDTPRVAYADELDERAGRATERAELIRVQCALAKHSDPHPLESYRAAVNAGMMKPDMQAIERVAEMEGEIRALRDRSEAIFRGNEWVRWADLTAFARAMKFADHGVNFGLYPHPEAHFPNQPIRVEFAWRRGFISSLTLRSAIFLAFADDAQWHPKQTIPCNGWLCTKKNMPPVRDCTTCHGKGRIQRPRPTGAQPIEQVTFNEYDPAHFTVYHDGHGLLSVGVTNRPESRIPITIDEFNSAERDPRVWKKLCETAWGRTFPGIKFTLPDVQAALLPDPEPPQSAYRSYVTCGSGYLPADGWVILPPERPFEPLLRSVWGDSRPPAYKEGARIQRIEVIYRQGELPHGQIPAMGDRFGSVAAGTAWDHSGQNLYVVSTAIVDRIVPNFHDNGLIEIRVSAVVVGELAHSPV